MHSFHVLYLFAHFFQLPLDRHRQPRQRRVLRFGANRVHFPSHLLEPELDFLAHRAFPGKQLTQRLEMGFEAGQLLADVGALRGERGVLVQPLLFNHLQLVAAGLCQQFADALLKTLDNRMARFLGQPSNLFNVGLNSGEAGGEVALEAPAFAGPFRVQRLQGRLQGFAAQRELGAEVAFLLDDLENFRPADQGLEPRLSVQAQALLQPAQLVDIAARQLVIDDQAAGGSGSDAADADFDTAARGDAADQLAELRFLLVPSARQIELDFKEALVDRPHLRLYLQVSAFGAGAAETRHAAHGRPFLPRIDWYTAKVLCAIISRLKLCSALTRA